MEPSKNPPFPSREPTSKDSDQMREELGRRFVANRRRATLRRLELLLWMGIPIIYVVFQVCYRYMLGYRVYLFAILPELFGALSVLLIPIVFDLVFQALPFEFLRNLSGGAPDQRKKLPVEVREVRLETGAEEELAVGCQDTLSLLRKMSRASNAIAEKIYTRAGVYLLLGVLIAFSGLGFFYVQSPPIFE